jgi:hypothetical protein
MGVQLVHRWEALPVFPEELDQLQLGEHSNNVCGAFFGDQDSVYAAPKDLHSFRQVGCVWEGDQRLLLVAHLLDIFQRYRLSFSTLLGELVERGDVFFVGVCETDYE